MEALQSHQDGKMSIMDIQLSNDILTKVEDILQYEQFYQDNLELTKNVHLRSEFGFMQSMSAFLMTVMNNYALSKKLPDFPDIYADTFSLLEAILLKLSTSPV